MESQIKRLLWLYFLLIVGEGVLRKWVFPGLSEPLLIIRDPIALIIYGLALMCGRFPIRPSILFLGGLAIVSAVFGMVSGAPPFVVLYGVRINYFHVPLIFIMADLLDRRDIIAYGRAVLWLTIPIGLLMFLQFRAGPGTWLNAGAGGDLDSQLRGALGKVRPPGPFTFISGPILWFSLATAFTFYGWMKRGTYPRLLLMASTCMIVIAIPISISRMLMFSVFVVLAFGGIATLRNPRQAFAIFAPLLLIAITFAFIGGGEMTEAFASRWKTSNASGFHDSVIARFFSDYFGVFDMLTEAPLFGFGIGMGSNVGARFTTGRMGFQLAEAEWTKIVLELGPLVGLSFIFFRCWLAVRLLFSSWISVFSKGDSLPWLLCGACVLPVINGQWGPPTILGFAVFGAGLTLAASRTSGEPDELIEDDDESVESDEDEDDATEDEEIESEPEPEPLPRRRRRV